MRRARSRGLASRGVGRAPCGVLPSQTAGSDRLLSPLGPLVFGARLHRRVQPASRPESILFGSLGVRTGSHTPIVPRVRPAIRAGAEGPPPPALPPAARDARGASPSWLDSATRGAGGALCGSGFADS